MRTHPKQPRESLIADVLGRALDLQLVHFIDQNGSQNADDDDVLVLGLGQGMVEGVEVSGRDQHSSLQSRARELVRRPKTR